MTLGMSLGMLFSRGPGAVLTISQSMFIKLNGLSRLLDFVRYTKMRASAGSVLNDSDDVFLLELRCVYDQIQFFVLPVFLRLVSCRLYQFVLSQVVTVWVWFLQVKKQLYT